MTPTTAYKQGLQEISQFSEHLADFLNSESLYKGNKNTTQKCNNVNFKSLHAQFQISSGYGKILNSTLLDMK